MQIKGWTLDVRNGIGFVVSPLLGSVSSITHAFLTRLGGRSKGVFSALNFDPIGGDKADNILYHRGIVGELFGFDPTRLVTVNQVHSSDILVIDKPLPNIRAFNQISADGIVTDQKGLAIGVLTADCLPNLLFAPSIGVVGVIHAGRRGTLLGITERVIDTMVERFDVKPRDILAALGPCIGPCCYETDIRQANYTRLAEKGVLEENISTADICTSCLKETFFSYRGNRGRTGRQLNFIMMRATC